MRFLLLVSVAVLLSVAFAAPPAKKPEEKQAAEPAAVAAESSAVEEDDVSPDSYPAPQIDWGKCPQLTPTEADKEQKRLVIQKCLEQNPPPAMESISDPKQIDDHRELVTTCALKTEGWFNDDGTYKFDRAKKEIESKKLDAEVEKNISKRHEECQEDSVKRFPGGFIEQVQLYQACMDYHIAEICEIELIPPPGFPIEEYIDYDDILPENAQIQDEPQAAAVEEVKPEEGKKPAEKTQKAA